MSDRIERAKESLDSAITNVARCAQEVVSSNTQTDKFHGEYFCVNKEDMGELKEALAVWSKATQEFLSAARAEGGKQTSNSYLKEMGGHLAAAWDCSSFLRDGECADTNVPVKVVKWSSSACDILRKLMDQAEEFVKR